MAAGKENVATATEEIPDDVADTSPTADDSDEGDIEALEALVAAESALTGKVVEK